MAEVTETAPPPQERPNPGATDDQAPPAETKEAPTPTFDAEAFTAMQAQLEALTSQLTSLRAEKADAEAKAEEARQAKLTAAEKQAERVAALESRIAESESAALAAERARALSTLGIRDKFHGFAPDGDPRTEEGRTALERWAQDNPELRKAAASPADLRTDDLPKGLAEKAQSNPFLAGARGALREAKSLTFGRKGVR